MLCNTSLTEKSCELFVVWYNIIQNPFHSKCMIVGLLLLGQNILGTCKSVYSNVSKQNVDRITLWFHEQNFSKRQMTEMYFTKLDMCLNLRHIFVPEVMYCIFSCIYILNLVVEHSGNRNALYAGFGGVSKPFPVWIKYD